MSVRRGVGRALAGPFILAMALAQEPPNWLEPNRTEPAGTHYRTFGSKLVGSEVSYLVYLPPDYETNASRRYPVV
jgi:hypothetical protein